MKKSAEQFPSSAKRWSLALTAVVVILGALGLPLSVCAQAPRINGRVVDLATGDPISDATVTLTYRAAPDSIVHKLVTSDLGLFRVERTRSGDYDLRVEHLAYGTFSDALTLTRGEGIALRITMSSTAIELNPVVVEAVRDETREGRARGTARRVATAEDIRPIAETGAHLAVAMSQLLPGVNLTGQRSTPGQMVCLQFRSPVTLSGGGCLAPVVMVDGIRQANSMITLNTMVLTDIQRIEVIPPGEAGVQFGNDARYGVVLIETFQGRRFAGADTDAEVSPGIYNWALESQPYPWAKTLAFATAANAVALLVGYGIAQSCLDFDDLTRHFYDAKCGFLGNTGSRAALYFAPHIGVGYVVQRLGDTDLSQGNMWRSAVASTILSVPGVILSLTTQEDGFNGSKGLGTFLMAAGAPFAAVAADRLFRRVHR